MNRLTYDPDSPSGFMRGDKVAGYEHGSGYWVVRYKGEKYYAHRLVWLLLKGALEDGLEIDHIDGNKANNSVENLRAATKRINSRNKSMLPRNTSGITGVAFRTVKGHDYWVARWRHGDESKERHFSCNKYGYDVAKQLAISTRDCMISLPSEGYTERHGRK